MKNNETLTFYFDWNIITCFKQLEKLPDKELSKSLYKIRCFIENAPPNFYFPYSNAHIRDLVNGYPQNKDYIDIDLKLLSTTSRDICVTQYWGEPTPKFHERDPQNHFWDIESDKDMQNKSLEEYLQDATPFILPFVKSHTNVPFIFKLPSNSNPIFNKIFSHSLKEQTMYGLMKDIFELHKSMFSDYTIYKEIRGEIHKQFIITRSGKTPQLILQKFESNFKKKEFEAIKELADKTYSKNPFFDRYISAYTLLDNCGILKEKLSKSNTIKQIFNDALHSFYGAHCNYFITNDNGTFEKSSVLYEKHKIKSKILTPHTFVELIENGF